MSYESLQVLVSGQVVGELVRSRSGLTSFVPDRQWLEREQWPRLGWSFVLEPNQKAGTGLPAWFENLLPEAESLLRKKICQQFDIRETDSLRLLHALGEDLPGAVVVRGERPLDHDHSHQEQGRSAEPFRFSLAGMQLKFSMVQRGKKLTLPSSGESGRWIVKIPGTAHPDLPEIEDCTMRWASLAGFDVPEHMVIAAEDITPYFKNVRSAFAIKRYDRLEDASRVHQEDFCQIFNISPEMKYDARVSYASLARLIYDVCGEDQQKEFIQRLAFVILSGNNDAHLKNWSLLWTDKPRPSLTPCYDLVSTVSWLEEQENFQRDTLSLGFIKKKFSQLTSEMVDKFAAKIEQPNTRQWLFDALTRARDAWTEIEPDAPARMRGALQTHWRNVPLLRPLR